MKFEKSKEYRKTANRIIPGGCHTYSKGDDQFPAESPAAIDHGKGAWVWDIDGNKFLDCSMGLTSVSLGHAFEPIIESVKKELERGVNFQRPSIIEKEMAEEFLSLVPQHQMIKFGKNGSTVTTAAVKLARAFTGRTLIAFPGDHPFYSYDDWFIGKTACNKGVPEEISNLSVTFKSCDINSLKQLFEKYPGQIACVITEPERSSCDSSCSCNGDPGSYLRAAEKLIHDNGALLIVDEMITGFKTNLPGSINKFGVNPDLATWGKGIANGFSFCALTGKREVMQLGSIDRAGQEKVFLISTTHGGETHAIRAGITTIKFFRNNNVIQKMHETGRKIIDGSRFLISQHRLEKYISVSDSVWFVTFTCKNKNQQVDAGFRTLLLQEMIQNGILFQGLFCPCFSHNSEEIEFFLTGLDKALNKYAMAVDDSYEKFLVGDTVKAVFRKFL